MLRISPAPLLPGAEIGHGDSLKEMRAGHGAGRIDTGMLVNRAGFSEEIEAEQTNDPGPESPSQRREPVRIIRHRHLQYRRESCPCVRLIRQLLFHLAGTIQRVCFARNKPNHANDHPLHRLRRRSFRRDSCLHASRVARRAQFPAFPWRRRASRAGCH